MQIKYWLITWWFSRVHLEEPSGSVFENGCYIPEIWKGVVGTLSFWCSILSLQWFQFGVVLSSVFLFFVLWNMKLILLHSPHNDKMLENEVKKFCCSHAFILWHSLCLRYLFPKFPCVVSSQEDLRAAGQVWWLSTCPCSDIRTPC